MSTLWEKISDCSHLLGHCLVIGGSGFLGQALSLQLHRTGVAVRTLSRHIPTALQPLGIDCVAGDIRDANAVASAMTGIDTVFHTASCCDMWGRKEKFYSINVLGTQSILKNALLCGVKRLIYTSTPSVVVGRRDIIDGDESLPYPDSYTACYPSTKQQAEQLVLNFAQTGKLSTVALRPHLIWGHDDPHILPQLRLRSSQNNLFQVGNGYNEVSLTHIGNAVYAHILAAMALGRADSACNGQSYFISDSQPVLLWQWISSYLQSAGYPGIHRSISTTFAYVLATISELFATILPWIGSPGMTRFMVRQLTQSHSFSWQKAHRDFGYTPIISNDLGLQEAIHHANIWS